MEREKLNSRIGFLLISAGCAIGVGNVWKFPWMVGENGGAAFVIVYLVFLLILGLPTLAVEFALGRASQKSPLKMYDVLAPKKTYWFINGYVSFFGNILLMMFYTTVAAWMLYYFVSSLFGSYQGLNAEEVGAYFENLCADPKTIIIYMILIIVLGFYVISFSLNKGLEKVSKIMMSVLLIVMIILAIYSCTLSGASEGLKFYLLPDFSKINLKVIVDAMNQAFFTLSLGIGAMAIFGSYINKDYSLVSESKNVILLDTFVAFMSGLIIFPACFTYGIKPTAGPSLIFVTLPNIFNNMQLGRLWGSLFFLFMTFAAFSTILAVFENILACFRELTNFDRKKSSFICCIAIIILSIPCALGFNILSNVTPFGEGSTILDLEDFIVSNCILPLGSLVFVMFACFKNGWGFDNFLNEVNTGKGMKFSKGLRFYMTYILPLIILIIFILGVKPYIIK